MSWAFDFQGQQLLPSITNHAKSIIHHSSYIHYQPSIIHPTTIHHPPTPFIHPCKRESKREIYLLGREIYLLARQRSVSWQERSLCVGERDLSVVMPEGDMSPGRRDIFALEKEICFLARGAYLCWRKRSASCTYMAPKLQSKVSTTSSLSAGTPAHAKLLQRGAHIRCYHWDVPHPFEVIFFDCQKSFSK